MPRKTSAKLLALATAGALTLAGGAAAPIAQAATTETSSNWAGYAVAKTGIKYRHVSASWTQKAVDCSSSSRTYSAYWVGLGGLAESSEALEQIGTDADCSSGGTAKYTAWYELVPQASVNITSLAIKPGDQLSASVDVRGHTVKLRLTNVTRHKTFTRTLTASQVDTSSAEWIVEAPSLCDEQLQVCETQALANFGTAGFRKALATTSGGHTGPVSDAAWSATAISLNTSSNGGGPGGFGRRRFDNENTTSATATPSALSASGSSFTITYAATTSQQTSTTEPTMPGGYDGGPPPPGSF